MPRWRCAVRGGLHSPLLHSRPVLALARDGNATMQARDPDAEPGRSRTVPERLDKNEEAKVGRSSDDAQRALLRLIQPANRVREPRVFGE